MNNGIKLVLTFTIGAAVGSVVTWKLLKDKYAQLAQDEIDSVKEVFSKIRPAEEMFEGGEEQAKPEISEETKEEYENITKNYKKGGSKSMTREDMPYVISPQAFNDSTYPAATLTYYANHVLVDECGDVVDDIDGLIGIDALNRFGEYEPDTVFVRNDALGIDYEILMDDGIYSEVENNVNPAFDD